MSSLSKIIGTHKPEPAKLSREEIEAEREKVEDIVRELVVGDDAPAAKKPPGRPRKNSTGKSPGRPPKAPAPSPNTDSVPDPVMVHPATPEAIADQIANRTVVNQLRAYIRRFPRFAGMIPPDYNPYMHTSRQNKMVIQAIVDDVEAEIEFLTAPALISDTIRQIEDGAMLFAATNPGHPAAGTISSLYNVSDAILSDPAINLDIGLLECSIQARIPKNPFVRLAMNIARVIWKHYTSRRRISDPVTPNPSSAKFDGF